MPKKKTMYKYTWNEKLWTKDNKPIDLERPFHRINSPSYILNKDCVTGKGYDCGCRSPTDYDYSTWEYIFSVIPVVSAIPKLVKRHIISKLLVAIPGWVPVQREFQPDTTKDKQEWKKITEEQEEKELEGVLSRSFQTWTDVPGFQWHKWYDWNFHVVPAPGYRYLRGLGNDPSLDPNSKEAKKAKEEAEKQKHKKGKPPVKRNHPKDMECEWDCGAFGDYNYIVPKSPTEDNLYQPTLSSPGPMFDKDWAWPMAGQYVWITGRWIYDCGHASSEKKTALMRSELHPCRAIATARWEAVKFDEHEHYVPAIQFMFFASKGGGYLDFEGIDGTDYEFIVDLPKYESSPIEYPIGHSQEFALNTLLIRPRLLIKLDYSPFTTANERYTRPGEADPQIELLPPKKPGNPPQQVKVKIPLTELEKLRNEKDEKGKPKTCASYGVIISLGWFDPAQVHDKRVKQVTVTLLAIKRSETHETGSVKVEIPTGYDDDGEEIEPPEDAEWQIKLGVNGRWFASNRRKIEADRILIPLQLGRRVILHLAEDDYIYINSHGMEEDAVGDWMRKSVGARTIKEDGTPYVWKDDIDQPDMKLASRVARRLAYAMKWTFGNQNDRLTVIDPGYDPVKGDSPNPLQVSELMKLTGPGIPYQGRLTGRFKDKDTGLDKIDYTLTYIIEYKDQPQE